MDTQGYSVVEERMTRISNFSAWSYGGNSSTGRCLYNSGFPGMFPEELPMPLEWVVEFAIVLRSALARSYCPLGKKKPPRRNLSMDESKSWEILESIPARDHFSLAFWSNARCVLPKNCFRCKKFLFIFLRRGKGVGYLRMPIPFRDGDVREKFCHQRRDERENPHFE